MKNKNDNDNNESVFKRVSTKIYITFSPIIPVYS